MLLVFIMDKKRRKGERRGNGNRSQDMDFVCLSAPPKKTTTHESCLRFSRVLFISFTIYFLLLTILFSTALISKYDRGTSRNKKEGDPLDRRLCRNLRQELSEEIDDIGNFSLFHNDSSEEVICSH